MKTDPFTDNVLGEWKPAKKNTKNKFCYERSATLTLHKDHAQDYIEPGSFKKQRVHGEVKLVEKKLIDRETSEVSMFRELLLTPNSVVVDVVI